MNRTAQILVKTVLKIVLLAAFWLSPVVSLAQAPTPDSSEQGIPLAEISSRAENLKRPMREIVRRLSLAGSYGSLSALVDAAEERIAARSLQLNERLASKPTLYELRELDGDWNAQSTEMGLWQKNLTQQVTSAESDVRWVKEEEATWTTTLNQFTDGNSLEAVYERIKTVLADLKKLHGPLQERLNFLLALQDRLSQLEFLVSTRQDDLAAAKQRFQDSLLVRDSLPLWSVFSRRAEADVDRDSVDDSGGRSLMHELAAARESISTQRSSFFFLLLLFAGLLAVNLSLARRVDSLTEGNPELHEAAEILKRPISASLLIILLVQLWLSPLSASVINGIVSLLLLIPFVQIVRSLFKPQSWLRVPFFILALLHLSDQVRFLTDFSPLVERLMFSAETGVAIAELVWMLRPKRLGSLPVKPVTLRWLRGALFVMLGLVAISLLANVLGFVTLAKVLGEGALHSTYLGALMYGAAVVINVGIALALRTHRAQLSNFVKLHRDEIIKWCSRLIYFVAGLLWLIGSLELFTIREQLLAGVQRVLNASLSFRSLNVSLDDVVSFLLVVALSYYLSKVVRLILQEDVLSRIPLERGVPRALGTVAQYLLLFGGFLLAVSAAGFDLNRLTLLTGAFGVGIGFGLQNIVNNFVSGLILLFERPVQIGDAVQVGTVSGEITRIGIRSSTIRTYQGAEVTVPNAKLISEDVTNWTLSNMSRRVELSLGVAYGSDPVRVTEIMLDAAQSNPEVMKDPAPQVLFLGFGESALQFELRFWAVNQGHPMIKSQVALAVSDALAKEGIEIPFPQRELHLKLDDETLAKLLAGQNK